MDSTSELLGTCPHCSASIRSAQTLIEYETTDETAVYAECPDCTAVVHPVQ